MPKVWTDKERAEQSARVKATWAKKRAEAAQVKTDAQVAKTHTDATSVALGRIRDEIEAAKDTLAKQLQMNASAQRGLKARTDELNELYKDAEEKLRVASGELVKKKLEVKARSDYRVEQEKEIEEMVEKGNDRLFEVDQEVKELLRKRDELQLGMVDLERQIADLDRHKVEVGIQIAAEENKFAELKLRYDLTAEKYRNDLMTIKVQIVEEQENVVELESKAKKIVDELVVKMRTELSRVESLDAREAELTSRERLLKSRESRYS